MVLWPSGTRIMEIAKEHKLYVIEDNAQAIGSKYQFSSGSKVKTGTIGVYGLSGYD